MTEEKTRVKTPRMALHYIILINSDVLAKFQTERTGTDRDRLHRVDRTAIPHNTMAPRRAGARDTRNTTPRTNDQYHGNGREKAFTPPPTLTTRPI